MKKGILMVVFTTALVLSFSACASNNVSEDAESESNVNEANDANDVNEANDANDVNDVDEVNNVDDVEVSNKDKAVEVLKSFESGDPAAINEWVSAEEYIPHNPLMSDGRDALIEAVENNLKGEDIKIDIKRVLEDGDHVVVHSQLDTEENSQAVFDIFRFENGKIVEHWDNAQDMPGPNPSGHTMVDGETEITDLDKTEENKELVREFYQAVLIEWNIDVMPDYFDGDNYIQHNPFFGDGLAPVMEAFQGMENESDEQSGDGESNGEIQMVLGEGNFVLVVNETTFMGEHTAVYDLYRVQDGKIAEHWDIIQVIPPQEEWENENGKF
jgi:predicted SnoaL-like aldol condensation-catalyzing enzyme